jgi:hypothetical protein
VTKVTPGYAFTTGDELAAIVCAAKTAGKGVPNPLDPLSDLTILLFVGQVSLAIGIVPIASDVALGTLPQAVQDQVKRAREIQSQRAALNLDLTPTISLCIAQANSLAGSAGWKYDMTPPLGNPLGPPIPNSPFTHD